MVYIFLSGASAPFFYFFILLANAAAHNRFILKFTNWSFICFVQCDILAML